MWNPKTLFEKHAREIQRFLQQRGHRPDVAADLTQDVFVRILNQTTIRGCDNPKAYLHRIARNLSVDLHRREQIVAVSELPVDEYGEIPDPLPGAERALSARQELEILHGALMELPEQTRRAFELYRLSDMTISEVADDLGLSISRTWTLIRRSYLHLRSKLNDDMSQN
ncbi:RNA polymerase sigma factor [Erwinia sp. S43]|uniref:RNA polymerase sigma factor n=1 Tax=Erwinia sp. S43 TaxID=2769339 RepID=UPI00190CB58C|nr:RNA polymerase sigma factor [Erwinia sp. S43]MBK0032588.1 RNA polymerase sigma factor [Erwinia sp. S43]